MLMCVQLFGKKNSLCISNYTLKSTINVNRELFRWENPRDREKFLYGWFFEIKTNERENVPSSQSNLQYFIEWMFSSKKEVIKHRMYRIKKIDIIKSTVLFNRKSISYAIELSLIYINNKRWA